jgi:DNA-binding transcriptional LysR family regulator
MFAGPDGEFSVQVSGPLETNNPEALRASALRDQGLILVPGHLVIQELKSGALVPVLNEFLPQQYSIDALYPHRQHLPAKVRAFIDVVTRNFRRIDWNPCAPKRTKQATLSEQPPVTPALQNPG